MVLKASHTFNLLDARSAISVTERQRYILRVRTLSRQVAEAYFARREALGFPMLANGGDANMTTTRDLLFEIGTEELPPKSLRRLRDALHTSLTTLLQENHLGHAASHAYATPRRLAVLVRDLAVAQPDREVVRRGPAVSAAFDADGKPTKPAEGFARSCGVGVAELDRLETDKGAWLVWRSVESGKPAAEILPELVEKALKALPVARRMRWGSSSVEFVRPVHWAVLLLGDEPVAARYPWRKQRPLHARPPLPSQRGISPSTVLPTTAAHWQPSDR